MQEAKEFLTNDMNEIQYKLDQMSAVSYYVTASIFSNWINQTLVLENTVQEKHLIEISGQSYKLIKGQTQVSHDFNTESEVFDISGTGESGYSKLNNTMEIAKDSTFYSHKLNVIRDSIQYNLNLAMSTYNKMLLSAKDYAMPVMQNEEWEKILNNVSIVTFMQGYNCGLKTYNNYKIVSSTNNEISILPEEVYYVKKDDFSNENAEYHRIDCPKLYDIDNTDNGAGIINNYISFISKEVKYDKFYDKDDAFVPYQYDHKNLACYECINDGNYKGIKLFDRTKTQYNNLRNAYYIGVGKARNNLYKMNAFENSEGYEIIYNSSPLNGVNKTSQLTLDKIKSIEVVLSTIKTHDAEENVLNYKVKIGTEDISDTVYTIVPNITTNTTIKINVKPDISGGNIDISSLVFENQFENSTAYTIIRNPAGDDEESMDGTAVVRNSIELVKVIYK